MHRARARFARRDGEGLRLSRACRKSCTSAAKQRRGERDHARDGHEQQHQHDLNRALHSRIIGHLPHIALRRGFLKRCPGDSLATRPMRDVARDRTASTQTGAASTPIAPAVAATGREQQAGERGFRGPRPRPASRGPRKLSTGTCPRPPARNADNWRDDPAGSGFAMPPPPICSPASTWFSMQKSDADRQCAAGGPASRPVGDEASRPAPPAPAHIGVRQATRDLRPDGA